MKSGSEVCFDYTQKQTYVLIYISLAKHAIYRLSCISREVGIFKAFSTLKDYKNKNIPGCKDFHSLREEAGMECRNLEAVDRN